MSARNKNLILSIKDEAVRTVKQMDICKASLGTVVDAELVKKLDFTKDASQSIVDYINSRMDKPVAK